MEKPKEDLEELITSLEEEKTLYLEMIKLSKEQLIQLRKGGAEELFEIAKKKGELLEKIEEIEKKILPLKDIWKEQKEYIEASLKERIDLVIEDVKDVLEELIKNEDEAKHIADAKKEEVKKKFKKVQMQRKIGNAYKIPKRNGKSDLLDDTR